MVAVVPAARGELGCRVRVRRWLLVASRIDSVPPLDMQPHTPGSPASPPPSMAAVIATTSASNFETEGHVEEWSGFETANIEAASFRTAMCCSSPEYTAPLSCPRFQRPSSCSLNPAIMPSSSTSATPELGSARWVFRGLGGAAMGWWWVPATCQLAPASHPVACLPAVAAWLHAAAPAACCSSRHPPGRCAGLSKGKATAASPTPTGSKICWTELLYVYTGELLATPMRLAPLPYAAHDVKHEIRFIRGSIGVLNRPSPLCASQLVPTVSASTQLDSLQMLPRLTPNPLPHTTHVRRMVVDLHYY